MKKRENGINRRLFLKSALVASAGAGLTGSFEEKALVARAGEPLMKDGKRNPSPKFPTGKLGNRDMSRLIVGGNLISGHAHSRDLIYVSDLIKNYHSDEKICETLQKCEEHGINTVQLRVDEHTLRIVNKYRNEWGGNIQWIAQVIHIPRDVDWAVDNGAIALYHQGIQADRAVQSGRMEDIVAALTQIKMHDIPAGVGAHNLETIKACEAAGAGADFYMKTLHPLTHWSGRQEEPRNYFSVFYNEDPEETIAFMKTVEKPWIAFKVLAAGAIAPQEGFKYALQNGADFIDVGMFDFQVSYNARVARDLLEGEDLGRERPWMA